ncbi:MAG: hypothetical protein ACOC8D_02440 [bacterium]
MSWQRIGLGIEAQRPVAELRAAFARTEIVALDLDECIYPGYTQVALSRRVARRLLLRPRRRRDRRFLPALGLGGVLFAVKEAKLLLGVDTPMRRLVRRYERVMAGVPEPYVVEAARSIPPDSFAFAAETVAELAEQAPTGLVSLGLDVVARAYREAFRGPRGPALSFCESNVVAWRERRGQRVFAGYDRGAFLESGADKRRALERRMGVLGAEVATVVGHSADDVPLATLARETGGLAVGYNPPARLRRHFDVVVRGGDWQPMYALTAMLRGARRA